MVGGRKVSPEQKKQNKIKKLKNTIHMAQHAFRTKLQPRKKGESVIAHRSRTGKTMGEFAAKRGVPSMMTGKVNKAAVGKNMAARAGAILKRATKKRKSGK